jgi:MFS family permease
MQRPRRRKGRRRPKTPMGRLLISSDFALLWLKQSITALCDTLFSTTLIIWVSLRSNSPVAVGLALASLGIPYAVFGPFAEAATERWSRRRTMFVTDVVRALLTFFLCIAFLPVLSPNRGLALICLLCFFIGLMSRFSLAAQRSSITAVVRPKEHARGISRIQGTVGIMAIIGPILAAMLFLMLGDPTPLPGLIVAGFLLLLSAGGAQAMDHRFTTKMQAVRVRRKRRAGDAGGEEVEQEGLAQNDEEIWHPSVLRSGIADSFKGVRQVLQQRPFGTVAKIVALVAFVGGIFNVLEVFFVSTYLGAPAPFLGLLVSANAAGFLLGSAWFRQLDAHLMPITTFTFAVLGMGLTTAGFIATRDLGFASLWAAAMGVTNGMILFAAQTTLVETGERTYINRLFVGYETLTALWGIIGIVVGSVASTFLSTGLLLGFDGGLLILSGIGSWLVLTGRAAKFRYRKAAAQNTDEHDLSAEALDEAPEDYDSAEDQPAEDEAAYYDEANDQPYEESMALPASRQVNQPWPDEDSDQGSAEYPAEYAEDEEPAYAEGDEDQWEPDAPIEEPPEPRRSLRLRPAPWEQQSGGARRRR